MRAGSVTVDICLGGCGGIWFDNFELQKLDEPHELEGNLLVNIKKRDDIQVDHDKRRSCPKCPGIIMMRHFFSPLRRTEVDECPQCGGYWLDAGELAGIREENQSAQERKMAAEARFARLAGQCLDSMPSSDRDQQQRAKRVEQVFRFSSSVEYEVRQG
jgi:uncharacterized protein